MPRKSKKMTIFSCLYNLPDYSMIEEREFWPYQISQMTPVPPLELVRPFVPELQEKTVHILEIESIPSELNYMSLFSNDTIEYYDKYLIASNQVEKNIQALSRNLIFESIPNQLHKHLPFIIFTPDHSVCLSGIKSMNWEYQQSAILILDSHFDVAWRPLSSEL